MTETPMFVINQQCTPIASSSMLRTISAALFSSDAFRSKSFCSCIASGTLKIWVFQFSMFIQEKPFKKMESVHRWCWSVLRVWRYFCNLGSSWESRSVFVILGVQQVVARGRSDKNLSRNRPHVQKKLRHDPTNSIDLKSNIKKQLCHALCDEGGKHQAIHILSSRMQIADEASGAFATAYLAFEPTVLGRQCSSSSHKPTKKVIRCSHAGRTAFWKLWRYARKHLGKWINKIRPMKPTI